MDKRLAVRVWFVVFVVMLIFTGLLFAQDDEEEGGDEKERKVTKSVFDLFKATGIVGWMLLATCIAGTAFAIQYAGIIKEEKIMPPHIQMQLEEILSPPMPEGEGQEAPQLEFDEEGNLLNLQDALGVCEAAGDIYLAKITGAALLRSDMGQEEMMRAMEETGAVEAFNLNIKISVLNLVGNIGPLIGLLGTVTGMITAFQKIESMKAPTPGDLASGIYESLVNTTMGLFIAIAFLSIYFFYKNNLNKRTLKANAIAGDIIAKAQSLLELARQQKPTAQ